MISKHPGAHAFPGQRERNHDDPSFAPLRETAEVRPLRRNHANAAESVAEVGKRDDFELDLLMITEREVVEFSFFHHGGIENTKEACPAKG